MELINKGIEILKDSKNYWKKPPAGKYMSYREIFAYSVGGIGAYSIFTMAQTLLLSTTNVIIGNTIGIQPMHMYVMYLISVVTNIPLTMLRANMVDNVRYRTGKYRPYLLRMGVPTVIISLLFVFTPYNRVDYIWRCVLIFIYNFGLQFFYNFFYDAYENLIHVLSPDTQERTNATAVKSVIYSLSPTITNFITPIIAGKVADGNMYDLRVYRWLYPFIAIAGVGLIILVYARTEEKIVQAKTHTAKVRFFDALREVAKNKYFWIISLAGWIGFLESSTYVILQWLYNYAHLCTPAQYGLVTFIKGSAYTWGMVLAPFAISKWGKKKVLIITNIFNILFLAMIYPLMGSIWTVLLCVYFNSVCDSFAVILNPTIQADIRDYQHYKTGERIDGMFSAVGLIGSFVTMATSAVLPAVYEKYGIFAGNGYENMYDILYNQETLYRLIGALVILSVVGAALNVIPFFFYDLTELKQKAVIRILRLRALFEDFGNNALNDKDIIETIDLVRSAKSYAAEGKKDAEKARAQAKDKSLGKEKKKEAKKELKAIMKHNEEVEISEAVLTELNIFSSAAMQAKLERARITAAAGLEGIKNASPEELKAAKALKADTSEAKQIRKDAVENAKLRLRCKKAAEKYYPNGVEEFNLAELEAIYEKENELTGKRIELAKEISADKKAHKNVSAKKTKLAALTKEIEELSAVAKKGAKQHDNYLSAAKALLDARKLIVQAENYTHFEEIDSMYDEAKARAAAEAE